MFSPAKRDSQKKAGVQLGRPETIRENQAIRANLRIDSRESGHLSSGAITGKFGKPRSRVTRCFEGFVLTDTAATFLRSSDGPLSMLLTLNRV